MMSRSSCTVLATSFALSVRSFCDIHVASTSSTDKSDRAGTTMNVELCSENVTTGLRRYFSSRRNFFAFLALQSTPSFALMRMPRAWFELAAVMAVVMVLGSLMMLANRTEPIEDQIRPTAFSAFFLVPNDCSRCGSDKRPLLSTGSCRKMTGRDCDNSPARSFAVMKADETSFTQQRSYS